MTAAGRVRSSARYSDDMWEINRTDQLFTVLCSFLCGVVFSLVYDVFKAGRLAFRKGTFAVVIDDIIFSLLCTFVTFCLLMLRTKGQVRFFVLASQAAGFAAARWTLSPFTVKFLRLAMRAGSKILSRASAVFWSCADKSGLFFVNLYKKFMKTLKKGLKRIKLVLYNHSVKKGAKRA